MLQPGIDLAASSTQVDPTRAGPSESDEGEFAGDRVSLPPEPVARDGSSSAPNGLSYSELCRPSPTRAEHAAQRRDAYRGDCAQEGRDEVEQNAHIVP